MSTSLAQGTWNRSRVAAGEPGEPSAASTALATAAAPEPAEPGSASATADVERLLVPQRRAARTALSLLRVAAFQLARLEPACAPALARVIAVADELDAAVDPTEAAGDHDRQAATLRTLRALAADVRAAAGLTHDTMVIFAAMATVARLLARQRELERWVLLGSHPAARALGDVRRRRSA